ncbi:MAG: tetratricopeptide repeat protein [Cyanobacteriota bacterium]
MLKELKILLSDSKASKKFLFSLLIISGGLLSQAPLLSATLYSLDIIDSSIQISADNLKKINIIGNNSGNVIISIPELTLNNVYELNSEQNLNKLKQSIPQIKSFKVVQYSLEPAEARIIINSYKNISPEIIQNEKENFVTIKLNIDKSSNFHTNNYEKPFLKESIKDTMLGKIDCGNVSHDLLKAIELKSAGNIIESEKIFNNILEENPENLWSIYYLSLIQIEKSNLEEAKELINKNISINPNFFASYYALGIINDIEGNNEKAIESYKQAILLNPDSQNSHYRLGLDYLKQNEYEQAEKEFQITLAIYPEHNGALQNIGLINLKKSNFEKANKYFKLSLRTDSLNNLGNLLLQSSELEKAIEIFSLALKLEPDNDILNYNIAKAFQANDQTEKAIEYYNKSIKLNPNLFNAHYNIAIIQAQKGENKQAIDSFYSYLKLNPGADDEDQITSLISKLEEIVKHEAP